MPLQSPDFTVPQAVTVPMLALDSGGAVRGANHAFMCACGLEAAAFIGAPLAALCHAAVAQEPALHTLQQALQHGAPLDELALQLRHAGDAPWPVRVSARAHGAAIWLTLVDATQERRAERLDELLNLVQQFGRLGVWERDVRTLHGRWDRHVYRFYGLAPGAQTPDFARAIDYVVPEDRSDVNDEFVRSCQAAGDYSMHFRALGGDGVLRRLHSQWTVKDGADGKPERALGILMDDTQVWRLARTVGETHAQLQLALQLGGIAIWRHDLATNRLYYDDQGWAILGMKPRSDGLTLAEVRAMIHPGDLPAVQAAMQRATDSSTPTDMEARYRHADGHWLDILTRRATLRDANGQAVAFVGVALDVTEQRAGRQALHDAHERAALAAHALGVGTWEYDNRTGRSTWDEQMWRLRGLAPRGSEGPSLPDRRALVHPDDVGAMVREYDDSLRDRRASSMQFRVRWPDGSWHWLASRSLPIVDEHGDQLRRIGVNWDVTAAREAEQAHQERLLAQRESRAKSQFLARMSHELRTPLNAVIGFAQLLLSDRMLALGGEPREQLQHIQAAGEHLLALVNDVLDLSSLDTGEIRLDPQGIELGALHDAALPMVTALAHTYGVRLERGELRQTVLADPTRLRQVLLNLLTNAIKYNRPGGTVWVQSHTLGEQVVLQVRDSGRGMTGEQLQHVFEPFNRLGLERKGIEGTGIGLAIVKANVERMGGTVHVQSTPAAGSVFEVRLPCASSTTPAPPAISPTDAGAAPDKTHEARTGRLLYIEDNPVNALIVRELLAQRGQLVLDEAEDGASGIHSAREHRPDLILVDMQLPDIDGLEVLRRLRADPGTAAIPCIALSANAMPEDIQLALGAGFADYWTKPLDFRVFLGALDTLFGKRA